LQQIATLVFREPDSGEECVVIVRAGSGLVALALSRHDSSDTAVILPADLAERVAEALRTGARAV
jgi:hypothetical protein